MLATLPAHRGLAIQLLSTMWCNYECSGNHQNGWGVLENWVLKDILELFCLELVTCKQPGVYERPREFY